MPRVSIIMPTYNQEGFIRESVDSVLAQTFDDFELIIVNDASPDNTADFLHALNDQRVKVLTHEVNKGASAAMNTGFAQASGEFHTWLASDNCFKPDFLEKMVGTMDAHPELGFLYCSFENVDADGGFIDTVFLAPPYPGFLHVDPGGVGVGFLYRSLVAEQCGPYLDLVCNDLDYWLKAARHCEFGFVRDVLAVNRKHGAMQTVVRRKELAEQVARTLADDRKQGLEAQPNLFERGAEMRRAAQRFLRSFRLAAGDHAQSDWIVAGESPMPEVVAALLAADGVNARAENGSAPKGNFKYLALDAATAARLSGGGEDIIVLGDGDTNSLGWDI